MNNTKLKSFYLKPRVYMGSSGLNAVLADVSKVLIVTEKFMVETHKVDYLIKPLESKKIEYKIFDEVKPDPDIQTVAKGVAMMAEFKPDMMIALGGGSAIDCAKGMRYFGHQKGYVENCLLTAVPTTSGTGSEVTSFTVLSDPERSAKHPIVSDEILPDIALLDAGLTVTAPAGLTADTGMDALTHAIESFVSVDANDFTDANAEKALRLIDENLLKVYLNPEDMKGRQHMHNASCLAGAAFSNSGLGINHSVAHTIGGHFHIPHGKCNAILLPFIIEYNAGEPPYDSKAARRYAMISELIGRSGTDTWQGINNLIQWVKYLSDRLNIPKGFASLGVEKEAYETAIPEMIEAVLNDNCTPTNPRVPTKEDLQELFLKVYRGR